MNRLDLHGRARAGTVATGGLAFVGATCTLLALRSACLAVTLSTPVPYTDGWAFVDDLVRWRDGDYRWWNLFAQHNEHRILTARLHFWLDAWFFHFGNLSVVVANYLLLGVLAAVLAAVATRGRPLAVKAAAFALALATLWSAAGWINLAWSFQIQWAYVHLLPVLSIVLFVSAARRRGRGGGTLLALAVLCDGLAVFSMSSGLMTALPIVAATFWMRTSPRLLVAFVVAHAAFAALFLWGYEKPPQALIVAPGPVLRYLAPYLGTVLPGSKRLAIVTGGIGIAAAALAVLAATARGRARRCPLAPPIAGLRGAGGLVLGEGLATAFGRAGLSDPTYLARRYGTPSELFWVALGLCLWRWLDQTGRTRAARGLSALALCGVVASNLLGGTAAAWRAWSAQADNEGFNIINGAPTNGRGQSLEPLPDQQRDEVELMRTLQFGPFAEGESRFRAPLNSLAGVLPAALPACVGHIDQIAVLKGTVYHLQGWAVTPDVPVSADWALAVASDGRVLGYARTWQRRVDLRRLSGRAVVLGYDFWLRRPAEQAGERFDVVSVFPGHTAPPCRLSMPDRPTPIAAGSPD